MIALSAFDLRAMMVGIAFAAQAIAWMLAACRGGVSVVY
jgi:hypothetical protein